MIERLSLGRLTTGHPLLTIVPDQGPAPAITDYSRFKHGDGALSAVYGNMLAEAFVPRALESGTSHLAVTSSPDRGAAHHVRPFPCRPLGDLRRGLRPDGLGGAGVRPQPPATVGGAEC